MVRGTSWWLKNPFMKSRSASRVIDWYFDEVGETSRGFKVTCMGSEVHSKIWRYFILPLRQLNTHYYEIKVLYGRQMFRDINIDTALHMS